MASGVETGVWQASSAASRPSLIDSLISRKKVFGEAAPGGSPSPILSTCWFDATTPIGPGWIPSADEEREDDGVSSSSLPGVGSSSIMITGAEVTEGNKKLASAENDLSGRLHRLCRYSC